MQSFNDSTGRAWTLAINVGTMKRVRALCNVDLYRIIEVDENGKPNSELLDKLSTDPILLVDVIYAICKPDADKLGITDIEFGEHMAGDAIEDAANALLDDLVDFFPEAKRLVFRKVLLATRRFKAATEKQLKVVLEDPAFDQKVESALQGFLASSGSTPESSASTPTA